MAYDTEAAQTGSKQPIPMYFTKPASFYIVDSITPSYKATVDASGNLYTRSVMSGTMMAAISGTVPVTLSGTTSTISGNVTVTSGYQPAMAASGSKGFVQITDGTNNLPLTVSTSGISSIGITPYWYDYVTGTARTASVGSTNLDAVAGRTNTLNAAAFNYGWNSGTSVWDRLRSTASGQLVVTPRDSSSNAFPAGDTRARRSFVSYCPDSIRTVLLDHGTVTANGAEDLSASGLSTTGTTFYITALSAWIGTLNAAAVSGSVPFYCRLYASGTANYAMGGNALYGQTHSYLSTPIACPSGTSFYTAIAVKSGAGDYNFVVSLVGYELSNTL